MTRRVLVARQDNVGDVLLCGPAIRALAANGAEVTLLCGPRGRAAAELLPGVSELLEWRADWIDPEPQALERGRVERLLGLIEERGVEEALLFTSYHQSPLPLALLLRMAGVGRIGAISEDYAGSLLDVRHRVLDDIHEVERALSLAAACGYELPPGDDRRLRLAGVGAAHPAAVALRPYVVVHPGASMSARAWPAERHAELVELLVREGHNVVVTGSPSERKLTAAVSGAHGSVLDLGGETTLAQLAATIAGARALVVGNSGPAHVAAAVGTRVVSLYAPTVPAVRWRPWGVPFGLLQREVPCAGCRARECPVPNHPCMSDITAEEALQALRELVGEPHGIPHAARAHTAHSRPAAPAAKPVESAAESAVEPAAEDEAERRQEALA